ncbi:MAG: PQQ-binding-like beta-propeller repeat protein [Acidobacteria bacterium]|nr:PQQ-binding-like beta-propeller repeat protein [Acidobacteriota bacterium]
MSVGVLAALLTLAPPVRLAGQRAGQAPPGRDFPLVGGDLGNRRFSTLTGITPENVRRLGGAWRLHLEGGSAAAAMQAAPVVADGVMYVASGSGDVVAVDAATGAVRWRYESTFGAQTNRGVAIGDGKVFTGQAGSRLVALDQRTGTVAWTTTLAERGPTPAPPVYFDGLVYMGIAGGESGVRGQFGAYDAATGREVWKFYTLPGPGAFGHETWEGDSWKYGGGPVWTHPALDPDLGLIYIAVGNAGPDNDGTKRGGDNLFTVSIVALDVRTGAYKWHFQEVHHDIWDYDNPTPPVLADVRDQGGPRKILVHTGKTGMLYILDRATGKPLVGIEERDVPQEPRMKTARTQPFPVGDPVTPLCPEPGSVPAGYASACIFGAYWDQPVVMAPGTLGGANWAPMSFSPLTGLVYVAGSILPSAHGLRRQDFNEQAQRLENVGEGIGFFRPGGVPRAGTLSAIDPTTNRIVWQKRTTYPISNGSGLLSTATGLLFHGEPDGRMGAYDIRTGDVLWQFQTGAGADAPAVTYEVDGEQYVAIVAGGNSFMSSPRGDSLWAFKLGGTVPEDAAPPAPPVVTPERGRGAGGRGSAAVPPARGQ